MRSPSLVLLALLLSATLCACLEATVTPGTPADAPPVDTHVAPDTSDVTIDTITDSQLPDTPDTRPVDTQPDVVTCLPGPISSRIVQVTLTGTDLVTDSVIAAPADNDSTILAWETATGVIGRHIDAAGNPLAVDITLSNGKPLGVGATTSYYAFLQAIPDIDPTQPKNLVLRLLQRDTFEFKEVALTGAGSADGLLFDDFAPRAKLVATPTAFAVYFTARTADRAVQGDAIRFFAADGTPIVGGWEFQCGTALDLRLAYDGTTTSPICLSGCGQAGVIKSPATVLFADSAGNCAGAIQTQLGSVVTVQDGLWANFSTLQGRSFADIGLVRFTEPDMVAAPIWLTDTRYDSENARLAAYEKGLLAGWTEQGINYLLRLDASGAPIGSPEGVGLFFEHDFYSYASGDVGWVFDTTGEIHVVRIKACE